MARPIRSRDKWRIRWIDESGTRRSEVFDSYRDAEYELRRRQAEVAEIKRGLRRARPADKTFGELCDYWIEHRLPRKRSQKDDLSILRRHLRPAFDPLRLVELTVEHVDRYVGAQTLDKKTVANHLTLLNSMMRMARDELRWVSEIPRAFSRDYRYLRTTDEIDRFLAGAREEGEQVFVLYATAVFTGLRAGEVAALQWADVNFERRLITVQRSFDGPTKADDVRYVPILDRLLPILRSWRLRHPSTLLFTHRDGGMFGPSARIFQEVLHRVLERAGLGGTSKRSRYITFHSLRHTFASHWVMNGGDIFRLQKILGHKSIEMTQRYAHLAPAAFADDYGRFGPAQTGPAKVVPLRSRG